MLWIAIVMGLVEGATEFLPISSTGHLIVAASLLEFGGRRAEVFTIFIQLGAILSVVWEYRVKLGRAALDVGRRAGARRLFVALALAFLPAAVVGLLTHDAISEHLFSTRTVALALIVGGLLILLVEALPVRARTRDPEDTTWGQALGIGAAQCLALWPGFSRSAATILGGMVVGLDRRASTQFSFFLAIPTMFAATFYDLAKNYDALHPGDLGWLALSFAISFVVALLSIRWLLRYVSTHSFAIFAWYRLIAGPLILLLL